MPKEDRNSDTTTMAEEASDDLDGMTYEQRAKSIGMRYTINDIPPMGTALLLGFQHALIMLSSTVVVPIIIGPPMGATQAQIATLTSTILFVSGLNTLLQSTFGDRLPIVQGGSFAYFPATFGIIFNPELQAIEDDNERFLETMRIVSGSLVCVGFLQMVVGYTGLVIPMVKYVGPITIVPVISVLGLALENLGFSEMAACFEMGFMQVILTILFAQYLNRIKIMGLPVFALFPVALAIAITWSFFGVLTASDVYSVGDQCRTDLKTDVIGESAWFRFPYPGQWGPLKFRTYGVVPMIGAMVASMTESIGDYYSCARLSGAPPPTPGIISRGLANEGFGVLLSGLIGTGNGTTSYSTNIAALSLTGVGSRVVIQLSGIWLIVIALFAKISAGLASMPSGMVGGINLVLFGLIVSVGIAPLQSIDLNSERNLFIVGFSIFTSLSVAGPAGYFQTVGENPFGSGNLAEVLLAVFNSGMTIALITSIFLDNTIVGTREERGLAITDKANSADIHNDPEYVATYSLPFCFAKIFHNCGYLEYIGRGRFADPPRNGFQPGRGGLGDLFARPPVDNHAMERNVETKSKALETKGEGLIEPLAEDAIMGDEVQV